MTVRPQTLMLTFLGKYVLGRDIGVFSGSFIEVFARLDVSEHATRSTLTRMVNRGLLVRHRRGQRMYFGLTPRAETVLADGERRVWRTGAVNRDTDGRWTLLGFSLPSSRREDRHLLRSRLRWAGFGLLQSGLWVAPGAVDVTAVLGGLGLDEHVRVFVARAVGPTDVDRMVRDAYDLGAVAGRYRAFLHRWDRERPEATDDLARLLRLETEWLLLVRDDPRVSLTYLPADWPAVAAEELFRRCHAAIEVPARRVVDGLLEAIDIRNVGQLLDSGIKSA
jgi:phenylacetic acid degradation operon negative regulatory protein